jgi:hypothetical protein
MILLLAGVLRLWQRPYRSMCRIRPRSELVYNDVIERTGMAIDAAGVAVIVTGGVIAFGLPPPGSHDTRRCLRAFPSTAR